MQFPRLVMACALLCATAHSAFSDISLPKIFTDHMVVQRNAALRIWGTAEPNETLTIKFGEQSVSAVANKSGKWSTFVQTGKAGGPFELEVASDEGGARVLVTDVLVGDVWLCGGQSNMSSTVSELENADTEVSQAKNFPLVRLFNVQHHQSAKPLDDFASVNPWLCCSSDSIKDFSATGFLFGKELSTKLDIPVGLIDVSREGITLEAWTPAKDLKSSERFSELLNHWQEDDQPNNPLAPGHSFNGMIAPLTKFPIAGTIWFQGESNVGRGAQFAKMFPLMIKSWRRCFGAEVPFYFAQPVPYRYEDLTTDALPEIWDAQLKTYKTVSNTGLVVTSDLGDDESIDVKNKQQLASRLALWALAKTRKFGAPEVKASPQPDSDNNTKTIDQSSNKPTTTISMPAWSGPVFEEVDFQSGKAYLSFRFGQGLAIAEGKNNGFTICGEDKKFLPAQAVVEGSKLIVFSDQVTKPVAVRFCWEDTAKSNLTNSSGLPASPFRTDKFPLSSEGVNF